MEINIIIIKVIYKKDVLFPTSQLQKIEVGLNSLR